jgi:oxygen-independent coproporphyrinogen-3 oxidase
MRYKADFVAALVKEIKLRKNELTTKPRTLYFGGGTPSQLDEKELHSIFSALNDTFPNNEWEEITFEANPEDLTHDYLRILKEVGITRLSIGVQSFNEDLLRYMNRHHSFNEAKQCVENAYRAGFEHISIDLIYGIPGLSDVEWIEQLNIVNHMPVNHLSCYALTIEQGTPLAKSIRLRKTEDVDDHAAARHFEILQHWAAEASWEHYEVSNLCRGTNRANHNSAYWSGAEYLGLGPAAHSFSGKTRRINRPNNASYIRALTNKGDAPHEIEVLSARDRFNETILTGIRTKDGIDSFLLKEISSKHFDRMMQKTNELGNKFISFNPAQRMQLKPEFWFQSDGIASELMLLESDWKEA